MGPPWSLTIVHCHKCIDYHKVTFNHLVPADDSNPEVLVLNIIEVDNDGGKFVSEVLPFSINPTEYTWKKVLYVLAMPRCCKRKKGPQDRGRINSEVTGYRDSGMFEEVIPPTVSFKPQSKSEF